MIDQDPAVYLSLIIPAYNEARRLAPSLDRVLEYLRGREYAWELIIVDDGSTDGTAEVARDLLEGRADYRVLRNEPNRGKALSVKRGLLEGRGKYLLFSDADLSTPIEETAKLLTELENGARRRHRLPPAARFSPDGAPALVPRTRRQAVRLAQPDRAVAGHPR